MNFPKGFSSGTNLMGHEITGCLLVKLFALHITAFNNIFPTKEPPPKQKAKLVEVSNMKPKAKKVNNIKPKAKKVKSTKPSAKKGEPEGKAKKQKAKTKSKKKESIPTHPDHNLCFASHVDDWILVVGSLLQWLRMPCAYCHTVVFHNGKWGWQMGMANEEWQMENGKWRMAHGEWQMANGK